MRPFTSPPSANSKLSDYGCIATDAPGASGSKESFLPLNSDTPVTQKNPDTSDKHTPSKNKSNPPVMKTVSRPCPVQQQFDSSATSNAFQQQVADVTSSSQNFYGDTSSLGIIRLLQIYQSQTVFSFSNASNGASPNYGTSQTDTLPAPVSLPPDLLPEVIVTPQEHFFTAIEHCDCEKLEFILSQGLGEINLEKPDAEGRTALTRLAGMSPNDRELKGITLSKFFTTISLLIRMNAKLDRPDEQGDTPLTVAIKANNLAAFRYLLGYGADPYAKGRESMTGLNLAAKLGRTAILEDYIFMMAETDTKIKKKRWFAAEPEDASGFAVFQHNYAFSNQEEDAVDAALGKIYFQQAAQVSIDLTSGRMSKTLVTPSKDRINGRASTKIIQRGSKNDQRLRQALSTAIGANQHYAASVLRAHGITPMQ